MHSDVALLKSNVAFRWLQGFNKMKEKLLIQLNTAVNNRYGNNNVVVQFY